MSPVHTVLGPVGGDYKQQTVIATYRLNRTRGTSRNKLRLNTAQCTAHKLAQQESR